MSVYADIPRWPRHGTWWGHLISDTSIDELHDAADRAGLHPRSFDLDHYDWPEQARTGLQDTAVMFVGNGELTRILRSSGLRIPAVRRAAARRARSTHDAEALGLHTVPTDFIWGTRGHAEPMPTAQAAPVGSFRVAVDPGDTEPRIQVHDSHGRAAARDFLERADTLARAADEERWVGQVLELPVS